MHQKDIQQISQLPWRNMRPVDIAHMSTVTGEEFAESLRLGGEALPDDENVQRVISEELQTDNLVFGEYNQSGDHVDMLRYFFDKQQLWNQVSPEAIEGGKTYLAAVRQLSPEDRMMAVVSREHALPKIFDTIATSHPWSEIGLGFYEKYLHDHIRWDGEEGGHGDLVKHLKMKDAVLERFWSIRLDLYRSIPTVNPS